MHGWRETMEDAHTIVLSLPNHPGVGFFGIFDGHSGSLCSEYIAERLVHEVDKLPDVFNEAALAKVCMDVDQTFLDSETYLHREDGCACIFSLIQKLEDGKLKTLHANIGDSRTVLAKHKGEGSYDAETCTVDHKPSNTLERQRIEAAGG